VSSRARWAALIAVALICFVGERALVQASAGHLLLPLDPAEYEYVEAIAPFAGASTARLATDPTCRLAFVRACSRVPDVEVHGSAGLVAGPLLHTLTSGLGLPPSTWTLRAAGLLLSGLCLLLWLVCFARSGLPQGTAAAFAALFVFAPVAFTKLNLVLWGTHEVATLAHAALLCAAMPLVLGAPARRGLGLALLAAVGAPLAFLNLSLLLPWGLLVAWVALRGAGVERTHLAAGASLVGMLAVAWVGWRLLGDTDLARAVGHEPRLGGNGKLASIAGGAWSGPTDWAQAPFLRSAPVLLPLACAAHTLWTAWTRRMDVEAPAQRFTRFLASYFVAALGAMLLLPFSFEAVGDTVRFVDRYYAHLYPVGFGVIATWAWGGARPRRAILVLVAVLWIPAHLALLDPASVGTGLHTDTLPVYRVDSERPRQQVTEDCGPTASEAGRSRCSWALGYSLLARYQGSSRAWLAPRDVGPSVAPGDVVRHYLEQARERLPALDDAAAAQGVGCALRVLFPPARREFADAGLTALGPTRAAGEEGYTACAEGPPEVWALPRPPCGPDGAPCECLAD